MRRRASALLGLVILAASVGLSLDASGNSAGFPNGDYAQQGCTCHGNRDEGVQAVLVGLPSAYEANTTYNLTLRIEGAAAPVPSQPNQGGFAVKASAGRLVAAQGQRGDGSYISHSAASNDQRTWSFQWEAPASGSENVTFHYAVNAVQGDTQPLFDHWNSGTISVPANRTNATGAPAPVNPDSNDTPGLSAIVIAAAWLVAASRLRRGLLHRR